MRPRRVKAIKEIEARMFGVLDKIIADGLERNRLLPDGTVNTTRPDKEITVSLSLNDAKEIRWLLQLGKDRS